MNTHRIFAAGVAGLLMQTAFAAPYTPRVGSAERSTLMNALRPQLGSGKKKAIITPTHFKVERGWAYMVGTFNYADGSRPGMDYMGGNFSALLHREGGKWRVKRRVYNGDVVEPAFQVAFPQAPPGIFVRG